MSDPTMVCALVPSPAHNLDSHPENVHRFTHLEGILQSSTAPPTRRLEPIRARAEDLGAVHPMGYLESLREACGEGPGYIDYAPTYVTTESFEAALDAAGATTQIVEAVAAGEARAGLALVRPPGHHATPTRAMGFCLLNNAALAARRAQALGLRRVMVVDFDVHHGNGTQAATETDPDILYLSTHQQGIYPGSGMMEDTGSGAGAGSVVNIPLPGGAGDQAFAQIASRVIVPLSDRFEPQIVLISAGFDAHWRDPLAGLQLSISGFHALGRSLAEIARRHCDGRIVLVLEGGYDPDVVAQGTLALGLALAGRELPHDPLGPAPRAEPEVGQLLDRLVQIHQL